LRRLFPRRGYAFILKFGLAFGLFSVAMVSVGEDVPAFVTTEQVESVVAVVLTDSQVAGGDGDLAVSIVVTAARGVVTRVDGRV
jgi:hypothetical protein